MTPRTSTQHGATASARRATTRSARTQAPSRSRTPSPGSARARRPIPAFSVQRLGANPAIITLVGLALFGVLVWSYYPVARVQYRETRTRVKLEAELAAVKANNAQLRKDVDRLKTPEGVEDLAREQLGLVKPGEHPVVVLGDEAATQTAAPDLRTSVETTGAPSGPWTAFLDAVFGVKD